MMWLHKKARRPVGPRQNHWKGTRAAQAAHQRRHAYRTRRWACWRRVLLTSGWIIGGVVAIWSITLAAGEMAPILQRGLEIREVKVTGIRRVTERGGVDRRAWKDGGAL